MFRIGMLYEGRSFVGVLMGFLSYLVGLLFILMVSFLLMSYNVEDFIKDYGSGSFVFSFFCILRYCKNNI